MGRHRGTYPKDWEKIARRIKIKAGWRCERCKHPHFGHRLEYYQIGITPKQIPVCDSECQHARDRKPRILTVHHLDNNKSNCADWNLAALCQVCHLQIQSRVIMEQGWLWEHTEWMIPHVEGMLEAIRKEKAGAG